jgi:hypothetical protein
MEKSIERKIPFKEKVTWGGKVQRNGKSNDFLLLTRTSMI